VTARAGTAGELVPLAERIGWMLGCRALFVGMLFALWRATGHTHVPALLWAGAGWLAGTALATLPYWTRRTGTGSGPKGAVVALTVGLLGDGVLLIGAWYLLGGLDGPVGYLIVLHEVAVTLLASFRTGTKLAMWYSLLALIVVEAIDARVLDAGPMPSTTLSRLLLYLTVLWVSVLATAGFAAVNERELRRRRYDSEVLRRFGVTLTDGHSPATVSEQLARFPRDELLAHRAVVVVAPAPDGDEPAAPGHAVVVEPTGGGRPVRLHAEAVGSGVLARAIGSGTTTLTARLEPAAGDAWLAELLPGARNLVVVPFGLDQATGALVVEHGRGGRYRSRRVERRMVTTLEQATLHGSLAIGRALLVDRIRAAADRDGLTRLANRGRFDAALAAAFDRAAAGGTGFALIMIDLDHFKRLNDNHGHLVGDQVLRTAARSIAQSCREGDLAARYGGEEFAVIVDGADEEVAVGVAARVHQSIRSADGPVPVTASIGVGVYPGHGATPVEVIKAADAALYRAKESGRDRIVLAGSPAADPPVGSPAAEPPAAEPDLPPVDAGVAA